MDVKCDGCGGEVVMRKKKVAIALGGSVAMIPLAALFGLKGGALALFIASQRGNTDATMLLRMKMKLAQASNQVGAFFYCRKCKRDAGIDEVWKQFRRP